MDAETEGGFKAVANKDKYTISQVNWSDIHMDEDSYVLRVYPASALPDDPEGRSELVGDWQERGMISPQTALRLMALPDTESEVDLASAASNNIDRQVESILDDGVYSPPEPFQDLALLLMRGQMHYNKAEDDKAPEERLQMLRDYLTSAHQMMVESEAKLAAQAAQMQVQMTPGPAALPAGPDGAGPLAPTGQEPA